MLRRIAVGIVCVLSASVACGGTDAGGGAGLGGGDDGTGGGAGAGGGAGGGGGSGGGTSGGGGAGGGNDAGGGTGGGLDAGNGDVQGCAGGAFLPLPEDPGARGPWAVGARTFTVAGLTTEIWYPAALGSDAGKTKATYDVRLELPASEQQKIPDSDNPLQNCDCYRDLPLDVAHGPYPVVSFVHGTAAFRTQSLTFMTHWASRGFVVVASDHPHIELKDVLSANLIGVDQTGDALKVLAALDAPSGDLAFLAGHIDMKRIGASGHSAGGGAVSAIAGKRGGIEVVIPMAAQGVTTAGDLKSSLVMSAANDGIAQPSGQVNGYENSTSPPKRFVQIDRAGHLVFSDLCSIGASEGGLLAIAQKYNVRGASLLASLANDGCPWMKNASYTPITPEEGWAIVNYATSAVLEETLYCRASMAPKLTAIKTTFPLVKDYREALH